jgi:hypothetical protein
MLLPLDSTGQAPGRRRGVPSGSRRGRRGPPPSGGKSSHPGASLAALSRVTNAGSVAYLQGGRAEARQAPGCHAIKFACRYSPEVCGYAISE